MSEMTTFLIILLVVIFAFGEAFKVISIAEDDDFLTKKNFFGATFYTGLIAMGEFNVDDFGTLAPKYVQWLFIFTSLITCVIMLNLFIAIISNSFDKINSQGAQASYREKAGLIAENSYLLTDFQKESWCAFNKILIFCKKQDVLNEFDTPEQRMKLILESQTAGLRKQLTQQKEDILQKQIKSENVFKESINKVLEQTKEQQEKLDNLITAIQSQRTPGEEKSVVIEDDDKEDYFIPEVPEPGMVDVITSISDSTIAEIGNKIGKIGNNIFGDNKQKTQKFPGYPRLSDQRRR